MIAGSPLRSKWRLALGRLSYNRRMRRAFAFVVDILHWLAIGLVLLILSTPALASFYLDARGQVVTGTVTEKNESLATSGDVWHRQFYLVVGYQPADTTFGVSGESTSIEVAQAAYDQLHVGSPVQVRYQPLRLLRQLPFFARARLADQNAFSGVALWWQSLSAMFAPMPAGSGVPATAQVESVTLFTTEGGTYSKSRALLRSYQRVTFSYSVPGLDTPVKAADSIDTGSVTGLEVGGDAKIEYAQDNPRLARLVGATYNYRWINALGGIGGIALLLVFCGLPALLGGGLARLLHLRRRARGGASRQA